MTRKEELLSFIDEHINESNQLHTNVYYHSFLESGTRGFVNNDKEKLKNHFITLFDDNLVGHSGDNVIIEILNWTTQDKVVSEE
jgi:hypothetical protein